MRVLYVPLNEKDWIQHFQCGNGFYGTPYQRGAGLGNIFRSIFRFILPVAKKAGKSVGKQLLKAGADVATDVIDGRSFKDSMKLRGAEAVKNLSDEGLASMSGAGRKRQARKSAKKSVTKKTKKPTKQSKRAGIKGTRKTAKRHFDQLGVYYS